MDNPDQSNCPGKPTKEIFPNFLQDVLNILSSAYQSSSSPDKDDDQLENDDFMSDNPDKNKENNDLKDDINLQEINDNENNISTKSQDIPEKEDKNITGDSNSREIDKNNINNSEEKPNIFSSESISAKINIDKVNDHEENNQSITSNEEHNIIPNFISINMNDDKFISIDSNLNQPQIPQSENESSFQVSLVDATTETEPVSPRSPDIFGKLLETHTIPLIERPVKKKTFETGLDTPANEQSMTNQPSPNKLSSRYQHSRYTSQNSSPIRSRPSTSCTPKRSRKVIAAKSGPPTEDELQEALDLMLSHNILPKPSIRLYVIGYAKKISSQKILNQDYDQATDIDIAIDILYTSIETDKLKVDQMIQDSILQDRFETAKMQKKETQEKYTDLIQNEINRFKVKERELLEKHHAEIENLKQDWKNPNKIKAYNKPSSKLFQLRKQQKLMALLHDFQNAKQLKSEAEQLEKKEAQIAIKKAQDAMKIEYRQLLDRQQKEIMCLRENHDKHLASLRSNQEKDIESATMRVQLLQTKLDYTRTQNAAKLPMLKQRSPIISSLPSGMITHRTRSQFSQYRKESDTSRLKLKFDFVDSTIITPR